MLRRCFALVSFVESNQHQKLCQTKVTLISNGLHLFDIWISTCLSSPTLQSHSPKSSSPQVMWSTSGWRCTVSGASDSNYKVACKGCTGSDLFLNESSTWPMIYICINKKTFLLKMQNMDQILAQHWFTFSYIVLKARYKPKTNKQVLVWEVTNN